LLGVLSRSTTSTSASSEYRASIAPESRSSIPRRRVSASKLAARVAAALESLASEAESSGDLRTAIEWTRRRGALDPLDEEAGRELIRRLAEAGEAPAALNAYSRLSDRLRGELGIAPSAQTQALVQRLRASAPAVAPHEQPPTPVYQETLLGAREQATRLVGRERELSRLTSAWRAAAGGSSTAVALVGEGGIGKTRLAEELLVLAAGEGARTATCAALDLGGAPPFGLWSELLRRLGRFGEARSACEAGAELAERVGQEELEGLVHHDRGLLALADGDPEEAAGELALALERNAPVSRPLTRLHRAEALARCAQLSDAEAELRSVALEPVSASDFPDTLVARMARVQGLIALARGERELGERRLREAAEGWRRRARRPSDLGEGYVTTLVDLGRPPISVLVEPERELDRLTAELAALRSETGLQAR